MPRYFIELECKDVNGQAAMVADLSQYSDRFNLKWEIVEDRPDEGFFTGEWPMIKFMAEKDDLVEFIKFYCRHDQDSSDCEYFIDNIEPME